MAQNSNSGGGGRQPDGRNTNQNMPPMPDFVRPLGNTPQGYRSNPFTPPTRVPRQYEGHNQNEPSHQGRNTDEQNHSEREAQNGENSVLSKLSPSGILKMLGLGKTVIDNDIIIIIMIFLMISGEKSDDLLTLALIYIML